MYVIYVNERMLELKLQTRLQNLSCVMRNSSATVGALVAGIDCVAWTSDVLSNPLRTSECEKAPSGVKVGTGAGSVEPQYSGAPWRKTVTL